MAKITPLQDRIQYLINKADSTTFPAEEAALREHARRLQAKLDREQARAEATGTTKLWFLRVKEPFDTMDIPCSSRTEADEYADVFRDLLPAAKVTVKEWTWNAGEHAKGVRDLREILAQYAEHEPAKAVAAA